MIESILALVLDVSEPDSPALVRCKQEDTGRVLKISLKDGGSPYPISEDCYVVFTARKPDGTIIHNPCEIVGNTILYRFTEQTCAAVGRMVCEIKLYGADDKLITSASFLMDVHKTVFRNGDPVVSEDEVNTLKHLISETAALKSEVESEVEAIVSNLASGAVAVFNRNAAERTAELDRHAGQLRDDVEAAVSASEEAFNRNAAEKTAEFDRHTGELQQAVAALQTAQAETLTALSGTDRRLQYLRKKNAGILYDTEMVTGSGSQVSIPSGAMDFAVVNRIGGVSRRGRNLYDLGKTIPNNSSANVQLLDTGIRVYCTTEKQYVASSLGIGQLNLTVGKTYTLSADVHITCGTGRMAVRNENGKILVYRGDFTQDGIYNLTFTLTEEMKYIAFFATVGTAAIGDITFANIQLEEGSSVTAWEPFADHLIHAGVDAVISRSAVGAVLEEKAIPQAIRDACPDYGIGVNADCCNYIDFEEKAYHHRVAEVDMGTLPWSYSDGGGAWPFYAFMYKGLPKAAGNGNLVTGRYKTEAKTSVSLMENKTAKGNASAANVYIRDDSFTSASDFKAAMSGTQLCYELAKEEVIDLSGVWGDLDEVIRVEAGGSLRMHYPEKDNGFEMAVPSRTEILVSVAEVE